MIAIVTGDGGLLKTTVPAELESEHPEFFDSSSARPDIETGYQWEEGVLTVSFGDGREAVLERTNEDEPTVVGTFPDGTQTAISLEDTQSGWRVTQIDGMDVAELLKVATADLETLEASVNQDICFAGQLGIELAAESVSAMNGAVSLDPNDYIPSLLAEPYFCPDAESQYSDVNSDFGFIEGLSEEGRVAPCSVHGYHEDAE